MSAACSVSTATATVSTCSATETMKNNDETLPAVPSTAAQPKARKTMKGKRGLNNSQKVLNLDDPVWLVDPVSGVLQGVVTHMEVGNVWIQLTGPSLGKDHHRKRMQRKGLSVHIERKNFVTAPLEKVYLRLSTEECRDTEDDTYMDDFIEQRQSTVNADFPCCVPKKKPLRRLSLSYFRKRRIESLESDSKTMEFAKRKSILCERDLACLEHILSLDDRTPFCIWDPLLSDPAIVLASPAFVKFTGHPLQRIIHSNLDFLQGEQTDKAHCQALVETFQKRDNLHMIVLHYQSDGEAFFHRLFMTPLCDERQRVRYYLSIHAKATPTDAARINHQEGWPMPAIFNLKGSVKLSQENNPEKKQRLQHILESGDESEEHTLAASQELSVAVSEEKSLVSSEGDVPAEWLPDFSLHTQKDTIKLVKKKKKSKSSEQKGSRVAPAESPTKNKKHLEETNPRGTKTQIQANGGTPKKKSTSGTQKRRQSKEIHRVENEGTTRVSAKKGGSTAISESGRTSPRRCSTPRQERHSVSDDPARKSPRRSRGTPVSSKRKSNRRRSLDSSIPRRKSSGQSVGTPKSGRKSPRRSLDSSLSRPKSHRESPRPSLDSSITRQRAKKGSAPREKPAPAEVDSSSSSNDTPAGSLGLYREKSIGNLHDMFFTKPSDLLSETHHTMTGLPEPPIEIKDSIKENQAVSTITTLTKSKATIGTGNTATSISDIHNVLYSQTVPMPPSIDSTTKSILAVEDDDDDDASDHLPRHDPPEQASPVSLASGSTKQSIGSISDVHSVLFSQATLSTTDHTILSSSNK